MPLDKPPDAATTLHDAVDPNLTNVRPQDLQDPELRSRVEALLSTATIDALVDSQFKESIGTLKTFGLYNKKKPKRGDIPAPTPEQAKAILAAQLTPEQREDINGMENPRLQLIPVTSMASYIIALNSHKPMDRQQKAYVSPWHNEGSYRRLENLDAGQIITRQMLVVELSAFQRADERDGAQGRTIVGWQIAVTEGAKSPKLLEGDDVSKTLRARGAWFKKEFQKKGVSGVDLKRMLLLIMEALKNGEPLNNYQKQGGTFIFINEEPEDNGQVSCVGWDDERRLVNISEASASARAGCARMLTSVVVDVPKAA